MVKANINAANRIYFGNLIAVNRKAQCIVFRVIGADDYRMTNAAEVLGGIIYQAFASE